MLVGMLLITSVCFLRGQLPHNDMVYSIFRDSYNMFYDVYYDENGI